MALKVYINLLTHTRKVSEKISVNRYLFYDTQVENNDMWPTNNFIKSVQSRGDLGDRMSSAFRSVLTMEDKAVIIGSDCPEISQDIINQAFTSLESNDVVIGPTYDGGYYLLGMKRLHKDLFTDIEWSSHSVYSDTINTIEKKQLSYKVLDKKHDLDYKEDLDKFPLFMA
jgi:rSAM/selenodomain-associated transferase 1